MCSTAPAAHSQISAACAIMVPSYNSSVTQLQFAFRLIVDHIVLSAIRPGFVKYAQVDILWISMGVVHQVPQFLVLVTV
jgi:hypothetical protein